MRRTGWSLLFCCGLPGSGRDDDYDSKDIECVQRRIVIIYVPLLSPHILYLSGYFHTRGEWLEATTGSYPTSCKCHFTLLSGA